MNELAPKMMIPTLYDYWVHDVEVLKERGRYELYPSNPYETVINTRPPISYYNDNNPDWLNVMIFYHVLAHIDFFQNNLYFRHTWDYDFTGQALADKRMIAKLRSQKGRWVDYVIEFSRGLDNLVGYFRELSLLNRPEQKRRPSRLDYYFDVFLQGEKKLSTTKFLAEIETYNQCREQFGQRTEKQFFREVAKRYPEFEATFQKHLEERTRPCLDIIQHLMEHSGFLNQSENRWMKSVMEVVRKTSLFFQPQIRTKIMNEGWASYWHQRLFLKDDRISSQEVNYARVNAYVTALPRVGLNPYALGMRLFEYIELMADKGKLDYDFERISDARQRKKFDKATGSGQKRIFQVRENFCDHSFIDCFLDQDFLDQHKLFVSGKRLNRQKWVWEYFVKSRKLKDYRRMLLESLYHPPYIVLDAADKKDDNHLRLVHVFEGKPLVVDYIGPTMMGLEYLWGAPVHLETHEVIAGQPAAGDHAADDKKEIKWQKVSYTMKEKKLSRTVMR